MRAALAAPRDERRRVVGRHGLQHVRGPFPVELPMIPGNGVGGWLDGRRVVVSGSGNVATYAVAKAQDFGARVVACSDSSGYVVDEAGIDLALLQQVKEVERARIAVYAERRASAHHVEGGSIWDVDAEVALPCATQNELDEAAAVRLVRTGLVAVAEGANMPTTPAATRVLQQAGVLGDRRQSGEGADGGRGREQAR